jgi:adenosine deaminase
MAPISFAKGTLLYEPILDLHTHLAGILPPEILASIAMEGRHKYPLALLMRMGFDEEKLANVTSRHDDGTLEVDLALLFLYPNGEKQKFIDAISFHAGQDHTQVDLVYEYRSPIISDVSLCPEILRAVARIYEALGIRYAELSAVHFLRSPLWLDAAAPVVREIEERSGIHLRFLIGIHRHSHPKYFPEMLRFAELAFSKPYVVGYDVTGKEVGSLDHIEDLIHGLNEIIGTRPMVKRFHAGELNFPWKNIELALKFGATRIGHGLYGFNDDLIDEAIKRNVILELLFSSNVLLRALLAYGTYPVNNFIRKGLMLSIGTDGNDAFSTAPQLDFLEMVDLGVNEDRLAENLRRTDEHYLQKVSCAQLLLRN